MFTSGPSMNEHEIERESKSRNGISVERCSFKCECEAGDGSRGSY